MSTTTQQTDATTTRTSTGTNTRTQTDAGSADVPYTFSPHNRTPLPKVFDKAKFE